VRLFVALDLPEAVRDAVVAWQTPALRGRSELRPLAGETLHVTLCFLGERPEGELQAIAAACSSALLDVAALPVAFADVLWLPPRRPNVLTVAVRDAEDPGALAGAQAAVGSALAAIGAYVPEDRPFRPHITVARARHGARLRPDPRLAAPPAGEFVADRVALYRSQLGPGGAVHHVLQTNMLTARRPPRAG
jgi:2'-5' RNA ligase